MKAFSPSRARLSPLRPGLRWRCWRRTAIGRRSIWFYTAKYKEEKPHVLEGHEVDNLSKFMIQNGFCEFKKHEEGKKLSNYEAERINLAKKIMYSFGYKNAMPSKLTCPKCKGLFACQIKKLEKKEGTNKEIIPRNKKILTILNSRIRATKDISLMCLQCGHVFKNPKK